MRTALGLVSAAALLFSMVQSAQGKGERNILANSIQIHSHGVALSVTLANNLYPRDALVEVTSRVRNITNHPVLLVPPVDVALSGIPAIKVVDSDGRIVYPPALHHAPPVSGAPPHPLTLGAGHSITNRQYVILRGTRLSASVQISDGASIVDIVPGWLRVRLSAPDPPRVDLQEYPAPLSATFTAAKTRREHPLFQQWFFCYYGLTGGLQGFGGGDWTDKSSPISAVQVIDRHLKITPQCPSVTDGTPGTITQWHVVAGWPGHSVVKIDWPKG